jgi:hypothetical protein
VHRLDISRGVPICSARRTYNVFVVTILVKADRDLIVEGKFEGLIFRKQEGI